MKLFIPFFLSCLPIGSYGADLFTRSHAIDASIRSYGGQITPTTFWISSFNSEKTPKYFTSASGAPILTPPASVVSAYDPTSTRFSTSKFYALQNDHRRLIGHVNGFSKGEIFSIGYDTGINTQKLNINDSIYAGYAKTLLLTKSSLITISFGGWVGGKINESSCVDDYGRQYSCQSLTAWSDHHPNHPKPLLFLDLRHVWIFD